MFIKYLSIEIKVRAELNRFHIVEASKNEHPTLHAKKQRILSFLLEYLSTR